MLRRHTNLAYSVKRNTSLQRIMSKPHKPVSYTHLTIHFEIGVKRGMFQTVCGTVRFFETRYVEIQN